MLIPSNSPARTLLEHQRASFLEDTYVSVATREDRLDRLLSGLMTYEKELCDALMADYGYRSLDQSRFAEIVTSVKPIKAARRNIKRWMKSERRKTGFPFNVVGARAYVHYQPLGVVGIISPWNFPVNLTVSPLAGVLAAGNRAMIKPSEVTPATSEVLARMVAGSFDPTEVAVVTGGVDVGRHFSALPFDHLVYTGSEIVAKHIMKAAADNLVPLTLELGGKSPVVIGADAKLPLATKRILFGKTFNAGQVCLAPDYVFVPKSRLDEFIEGMQAATQECFPAESAHRDYVAIVNDQHTARIQSYVEEAAASGASLIKLGPPVKQENFEENIVPVTMVINPQEECAISTEEIFGPLLVVRTYTHIDEVVDYINCRPKPLALYYFGKSSDEQRKILTQTSSGGVTFNDVIMHYTIDDLPFGGVGASGMGAYHGFDGFKQFSNARAVYQQSSLDVGGMLRPPYGPIFEKMSNLLIKLS